MVNDPRVSQTLARLGGVYRDPSRVDRDASSLLKSSVGGNLNPIAAELFEENGRQTTVLVLQGTFAIHFRRQTYQILVDIYLPAGYPQRPPVCYIRLADNMYLKENHRHVGSDGKVYLPYLHEWRSHTHNLIELVVAMSSVFSADPPVFTRAAPPPPSAAVTPSTTTPAAASTATTLDPPPPFPSVFQSIFPASLSATISSAAAASSAAVLQQQQLLQRQMQDEQQQLLEATKISAAEEALRAAEERERQVQSQRSWEEKRTQEVRQAVAQKIQAHLRTVSQQCQVDLAADWNDTQKLVLAAEQKIEPQLKYYRNKVEELEKQCATVDECKHDIEVWLEKAEEKNQSGEAATATSIDDIVKPGTPLHGQMLDLSAENAALGDALYFLDRGLYQGHLTLDVHMQQVRQLAKRQFLIRAHLIKLHQHMLDYRPPTAKSSSSSRRRG